MTIRIYQDGIEVATAATPLDAVLTARALSGNVTIAHAVEVAPAPKRAPRQPGTCAHCGAPVTNSLGDYCGCWGWD